MTELVLQPCQSVAGSYTALVRSLAKQGKSLYVEEILKVRMKDEGLATTIHANCSRRSKRFAGHKTRCGPDVILSDNQKCHSRHPINQKMIIGTHLCGLRYYNAQKLFSFLDLPYMSFSSYKRCEKVVGATGLVIETTKVRKQALQEEMELTDKLYQTEKYGTLPALTVSVDMGWQKRSSGRRYDSPSGVLHFIGARSKKIIFSFVYRNKCNYCEKLGDLLEKYEDNNNDVRERKKIKEEIEGLHQHTCLKNFDGSSKSMECDAIVDLVSNAPHVLKSYIRDVVIDDDTNVRDNLQEDLGNRNAGRLEKCLAGIVFLADPSHQKRTIQNHYFELVGGIQKKGWMLRKEQAKKLSNHFAYFQQQIKGLALPDGNEAHSWQPQGLW